VHPTATFTRGFYCSGIFVPLAMGSEAHVRRGTSRGESRSATQPALLWALRFLPEGQAGLAHCPGRWALKRLRVTQRKFVAFRAWSACSATRAVRDAPVFDGEPHVNTQLDFPREMESKSGKFLCKVDATAYCAPHSSILSPHRTRSYFFLAPLRLYANLLKLSFFPNFSVGRLRSSAAGAGSPERLARRRPSYCSSTKWGLFLP
jgi:hypothetical protein